MFLQSFTASISCGNTRSERTIATEQPVIQAPLHFQEIAGFATNYALKDQPDQPGKDESPDPQEQHRRRQASKPG